MESQSSMARIQTQIFQLMANPHMRRCLLFSPGSQFSPTSIRLHVRHYISEISQIVEEEILIDFPKEFPEKPPSISIVEKAQINVKIPEIIIKNMKIEEENWKKDCSISQILTKLIENLQLYWRSYYNFGRNMEIKPIKSIKSYKFDLKPKTKEKQNKMDANLQAFGSEVQIQRLVLERIKQVLQDLINNQNNVQVAYYCLEIVNLFEMNRFPINQIIQTLLSIDMFRGELKKQLVNGRWVNKILKSSAGLKSKKQLIKHSSQLLRQIISIQIPEGENIQTQESEDLL